MRDRNNIRNNNRNKARRDLARRVLVTGVVTGLVAAPLTGNAADAYWRPRLQLGAGYDDNVRLAYDIPGQYAEESALYQGQVDAELGIDSGASTSTLFGRYWSQAVDRNDDYNAEIKQLQWNYLNRSERSQLTLNIDAQYDTTLTSEFDNSGLSLSDKKDRRYYRNKLAYSWQLSPLNYVSGEISGDVVRYIDADVTGLSDYDTQSMILGYGHTLSERAKVGAQAVYSQFEIPESRLNVDLTRESETDNIIVMLFGDYAVSARDDLNFQIGFRNSNIYDRYFAEGIGVVSSTKEGGNGQVFSAGYTRRFDASSLKLSVSRDLRPNGSGAVVEQDGVSIDVQHKLSELFSLSAGVSVNQQREPIARAVPGTSDTERLTYRRDFEQAVIGLRYSVSEQQVLALEVNGRRQRLDRTDTIEAESTAVYMRWYWNLPQKTF